MAPSLSCHIDRARFRDQIAAADPLRIPFDLPLVSRDQVGREIAWPEAGGPIAFEPALEGRFVWGDFDTIEFRPARPLRSGSTWTARPSPRLRAWDGSPLDRDQSVAFATPPLAWTALLHDSTTPDGAVVLALRFSDAVSPDQLTGRIEVKSPRGEHLGWQPVTHAADPEQRILVEAGDLDSVEVTLKPGIRGEGGPRGIAETRSLAITLDRGLALTEIQASTSTWGHPEVTARFTRDLDPESLADRVTVEPLLRGVAGAPLPVRARASSNWVSLQGDFEHGAAYRVTFRPGLRSANGLSLAAAVVRTLEVGDREPGIRFPSTNAYHFRDGALVLPLDTVNVPEVEVSVLRIYPNNLVYFRNAGKPHRWNSDEYSNPVGPQA